MRDVIKPEVEKEIQVMSFVNDPSIKYKRERDRRLAAELAYEEKIEKRLAVFRVVRSILNWICVIILTLSTIVAFCISNLNVIIFEAWRETPEFNQGYMIVLTSLLILLAIINALPYCREEYDY